MRADLAEETPVDIPGVGKTHHYRLKPTPQQERAPAFVVPRCRERYNAGREERTAVCVSPSRAREGGWLPSRRSGASTATPLPGSAGGLDPAGPGLSGVLPPRQTR